MDAYGNNVSPATGRLEMLRVSTELIASAGTIHSISSQIGNNSQLGYQDIIFSPTSVGQFLLQVVSKGTGLPGSPFPLTVIAGPISIANCIAAWQGGLNTFAAGTEATVTVFLRDSDNNSLIQENSSPMNFGILASLVDNSGQNRSVPDPMVSLVTYPDLGYVLISFTPKLVGQFLIVIGAWNASIANSPLAFTVTAGDIYVPACTATWLSRPNILFAGDQATIRIQLIDAYQNSVSLQNGRSDFFNFTVSVEGKVGNSKYIADISMVSEYGLTGYQQITFYPLKSGSFWLQIGDGADWLSNSPLSYTVFPGEVYIPAVRAEWVDDIYTFKAGTQAALRILLMDAYNNNISWATGKVDFVYFDLSVAGTSSGSNAITNLSQYQGPGLSPYQIISFDTRLAGNLKLLVESNNQSIYSSPLSFTVIPGNIEPMQTNCTGIGLTDSIAGDTSVISIQLQDIFGQPAICLSKNISIKVQLVLGSSIQQAADVVEDVSNPNNTGLYQATYKAEKAGTYDLVMSWTNTLICKGHKKTVFPATFFPMANDDVVWTWEGVLVSFDVLSNDYVANGNKILFMTDQNLTAYGNVNISVWMEPPQVISWPSTLQALEGQPIPVQGGFGGFQVAYTDEVAILDVRLQAEHGLLHLPAETIQLWYSIGYQSPSRYTSGGTNSFLSFSGSVIPLNNVLQSLRYIGNEYYNGNDTILLSIMDSSSRGDEATVMVTVMAINDPPYITAPAYMLADNTTGRLTSFIGSTIFFTVTSTVPGITVGDPDQKDIRDDGSLLQLEVVMQVTDGTLQVTLPISTVTTAENRDAGDYLWKPLEQAIFLDTSYNMTGQGLKFRASVDDCNKALDSLRYNGSASGVELTLIIDDMGNYGCYRDCSQNFIVPLLAEAKVIIFPKRPLSRWWAYTKTVRVFASTVGSIGAAGLTLLCLVICLVKLTARKRKEAETLDNDDMKEEQACEESRVYNPMWIPCTLDSSGSKFVSTPNPLIVSQRQGELRQRLRDAEMEIKKLALTGYKRISITALEDSAANAVVNPEEESRKINFSLFKSAD
ncbi:hypothetical protein O6H91_10G049500 [Diphasiastrum complanatum]|uniref:Uncharacterized protein n=1 Tax=Diphasiastrum complanatum TaxID=34168 RepID=A0ACC2CGR7_DIPCM|nr:hypothetical protein O6H91_10G049500 [Diphasiastrum complanatum]